MAALLIRFAGERMAGGTDDLVPVQLRSRRALSRRRARLGGAAASGAVSRRQSLRRACRFPATCRCRGRSWPNRRSNLPTARLGAARRRHAAGHGGAARQGLDRAVPCHRRSRLVVAAAVGTLCRHAAAAAGAVGRNDGRRHDGELPACRRRSRSTASAMLTPAAPRLSPIRARRLATTEPSRLHPPGLYGAPGAETALNAARAIRCAAAVRRSGHADLEFYASHASDRLAAAAAAARGAAAARSISRFRCGCAAMLRVWESCARRGGAAGRVAACCMPGQRAPTMPST